MTAGRRIGNGWVEGAGRSTPCSGARYSRPIACRSSPPCPFSILPFSIPRTLSSCLYSRFPSSHLVSVLDLPCHLVSPSNPVILCLQPPKRGLLPSEVLAARFAPASGRLAAASPAGCAGFPPIPYYVYRISVVKSSVFARLVRDKKADSAHMGGWLADSCGRSGHRANSRITMGTMQGEPGGDHFRGKCHPPLGGPRQKSRQRPQSWKNFRPPQIQSLPHFPHKATRKERSLRCPAVLSTPVCCSRCLALAWRPPATAHRHYWQVPAEHARPWFHQPSRPHTRTGRPRPTSTSHSPAIVSAQSLSRERTSPNRPGRRAKTGKGGRSICGH